MSKRVTGVAVTAAASALIALVVIPAGAAPTTPVRFGIEAAGSADDRRTALSYELSPGSAAADGVAVVNYSDRALTFDLYGADAASSADGGFAVQPRSSQPTGVGAWVTINERNSGPVVVPAEHVDSTGATVPGRIELPVRINVPAAAKAGTLSGAVVVSLGSAAIDGSGGSVSLEQRVALRVYVTVTGAADGNAPRPSAHRRSSPAAARPWLLPTALAVGALLLLLVIWQARRPKRKWRQVP
jgi:hypothetical protein